MLKTAFLRVTIPAVAIACLGMLAPTVKAATITDGLTFSVASSCGNTGSHFHSNTGGIFGNPPGKAEVGSFSCEEVRGLSEYDLAGLGAASSALVTFDVFNDGGLFSFTNDFPFIGDIDLVAYVGNNAEDISDYQAPISNTIGTFNTAGLSEMDTLSFDVTSVFNDAIALGNQSLGIRLQTASGTNTGGGAWTFDQFQLTTKPVPEPASTMGLLAFGALGTASMRKRKQQ